MMILGILFGCGTANAMSLEMDWDTLWDAIGPREAVALIAQNGTGSGAGGAFTIGTAGGCGGTADFATVTAFEAAIEAQLTGDLTGEHCDEETETTAYITFDTDTNSFLLKLTAQSGAEHDGTAYGNGARILMGTYDGLNFDEIGENDLDNVEISNLAFNVEGAGNYAININDAGAGTLFKVNRCLVAGDSATTWGIYEDSSLCDNFRITNNIIYGVGDADGDVGIGFDSTWGDGTMEVSNNTVIGCYDNIVQEAASDNEAPTIIVKNNMAQGALDEDYRDDNDGFGTSAYNISMDASSPNTDYRSLTVTDSMEDAPNSNFLLDTDDGSADFVLLDNGEDLSGTFTDDILGTVRSTWYIVAHETEAAADDSRRFFLTYRDVINSNYSSHAGQGW